MAEPPHRLALLVGGLDNADDFSTAKVRIQRIPNSTYGYAWFILAITVTVIAGDAASRPELAFQLAVYRTSETVLGVLLALAINAILWPRTGGNAYGHRFAEAGRALARDLRRLGASLDQPASDLPAVSQGLRNAPVQLREILAAAVLDSGSFRRLRPTFEIQIQALSAAIGSLMAFGEGLGLTVADDRPTLSPEERRLLRAALDDLADATDALAQGTVQRHERRVTQPIIGSAVARRVRERLLDAPASKDDPLATTDQPSSQRRPVRDIALRHALAWQLDRLVAEVQRLAESSLALAAGRALPAEGTLRPAPKDHVAGLPEALTAVLVFWLLMLLWIETQWPPVGMLGTLMGVVVIGIETLTNRPAVQPGRRVALGALLGLLITAPLYALVMPRLDGFGGLALVLLPFYFAILYPFNALAPPRNMALMGTGLIAIIMLQLEPVQGFDSIAWLEAALSLMTGFGCGVLVLGIVRGQTPQQRLRRLLERLLADLRAAIIDLADHSVPDFAIRVSTQEQRLRQRLLALAEVTPLAYAHWAPANDRDRIQALLDAADTLITRFRALQHARLGWERPDVDPSRSTAAPIPAVQHTTLGARMRAAFLATLEQLLAHLEHPFPPIDLEVQDSLRSHLAPELAPLDAAREDPASLATSTYLLAIHGHYIGVARALRQLSATIDALDWALWTRSRF